MAEDQVVGELVAERLGNGDGGKVAKAGGDTVGNPLLLGDFLRQTAGAGQGLLGLGGERHARAESGHGNKGLQCQAVSVKGDSLELLRGLHNISSL